MAAFLPSLEHLTMSDYKNVYEPSEDTFLLCDTLLSENIVFIQYSIYVFIHLNYRIVMKYYIVYVK